MDNEEFRITNDKLADWAIRKIKEEGEEKDRLVNLAQDQIFELEQKIENLEIQYNNKVAFLKSQLMDYFSQVPHKESKTQETYKLLSGTLVYKKPTNKIIHNDEELVKSLDGTEFVEIKKSIRWGEYKKNLCVKGDKVIDVNTGEIITSCTIEDVPPSFDIKY